MLAEQEHKNSNLAGWIILVYEELKDLSEQDEIKEVGERHQLKAGKSPKEYLKRLQTDYQYVHEVGYTHEDWLTMFAITLERENVIIDNSEGQGKACWNRAGYFLSHVTFQLVIGMGLQRGFTWVALTV